MILRNKRQSKFRFQKRSDGEIIAFQIVYGSYLDQYGNFDTNSWQYFMNFYHSSICYYLSDAKYYYYCLQYIVRS